MLALPVIAFMVYMTCVQNVPRILSVIAMEKTANARKGSLRRVNVVTVKKATIKMALVV